ncbi:hypothetical protein NMG60_11020513 [Bertholletia excelsa]
MKRGSSFCLVAFSIHVLLELTFFLLSETAFSLDPFYEACKPIKCGDQIISYPFWIDGVQSPFCGSPGFALTCQNNRPLLRLANDNYLLIHKIFYNNRTLRVSHDSLSSLKNGCFPLIPNISFEEDNFAIANNNSPTSTLFLLSNCLNLPKNLKGYEVGCAGGPRGLVMFSSDGNLDRAPKECKTEVKVPVEQHGGERAGDYLQVLKRGFVLKYRSSDCEMCETSGGRCGLMPPLSFSSASAQIRIPLSAARVLV